MTAQLLSLPRRIRVRPETRRLTFRPAGADDARALAHVFASNAACLALAGIDPALTEPGAIARMLDTARGRADELALAIVERASGAVVGMATLRVPNPADGVPWIGLLIVAAERQGMGLGSEAVTLLERLLGDRGWSGVRLSVVAADQRACRFWERLGYRPTGGPWRAHDGHAPAAITLGKQLFPAGQPDVSDEEAGTWFG